MPNALRIHTSTIADGNMDFRFGERTEVEEHRKKFFKKCGLQYEDAVVMQVEHEDTIKDVGYKIKDLGYLEPKTETCEALVTNQKDVPLMLLTADCYPCAIYDTMHEAVALLHLGWKSTGLKLVENVVAHMQRVYSSVPAELEVHFGPGIAKESYVAESPSQINEEAWRPYLYDAYDKAGMHVDVLGYNLAQCVASGILPGNIQINGADTYLSLDYFSHYQAIRTGGKQGRFATVVVL